MLQKLGIKKEDPSKSVAKERLQFILVQDRIKLSPKEMDSMREELLAVLCKYIDVDSNRVRMELDRQDNMMALIANFPLKRSI